MFYTTFTFVAAVLNQLAKSRQIATILKKDSICISYHEYEKQCKTLLHCPRHQHFYNRAILETILLILF